MPSRINRLSLAGKMTTLLLMLNIGMATAGPDLVAATRLGESVRESLLALEPPNRTTIAS